MTTRFPSVQSLHYSLSTAMNFRFCEKSCCMLEGKVFKAAAASDVQPQHNRLSFQCNIKVFSVEVYLRGQVDRESLTGKAMLTSSDFEITGREEK